MRSQMKEHYLTQQHQDAIMKGVHQMRSQLPDSQMDISPFRTTTTTVTDPATAGVVELYETLQILTGGIEALNDDGQRLSNESLQSQIKLQALAEEYSKVQGSMEESHGFLHGAKHNQDILNQDIASMKDTINDMRYASYDGTLVWKIPNVREKLSK